MGVHISRVKSVDLDTWTDEQLQSVLNWGNARANKYWEAKLAPGHVPSEAKIENFIRTKYELKRWAMDGPIPDPATLDADDDDNIPLSIVKEKQTIDRKESIRKGSSGKPSRPVAASVDLIGGDSFTSSTPPPRASTISPTASRVPPKAEPAPPKATTAAPSNTKDSLLGLDFLGTQPAAPARPASTTSSASGTGQSRPDLKQSILSLYATAPRQQQQQQPQQQNMGGFGGMHSPGLSQGSSAGFTDAFSNLSFSSTPAAAPHKPVDAFAGLGGFSSGGSSSRSTPAPAPAASSSAFGSLGGGSFFDSKSSFSAAPAPPPKPAASSAFGSLGGFDAFSSSPSPPVASKPAASSSSAFGDLFDFTTPAPTTTTTAAAPQPAASVSSPPPGMNSVFNLSSPAAAQPTKSASPAVPAPTNPLAAVSANWGNSDVWGNDGWGASSATAAPAATTATASSGGWGSSAASGATSSFASQSIVPGAGGGFAPAPKVAADEEFGGWASSTPAASANNGGAAKPAGGFGANEDLFSNVWN